MKEALISDAVHTHHASGASRKLGVNHISLGTSEKVKCPCLWAETSQSRGHAELLCLAEVS